MQCQSVIPLFHNNPLFIENSEPSFSEKFENSTPPLHENIRKCCIVMVVIIETAIARFININISIILYTRKARQITKHKSSSLVIFKIVFNKTKFASLIFTRSFWLQHRNQKRCNSTQAMAATQCERQQFLKFSKLLTISECWRNIIPKLKQCSFCD